MFHFPMKMQVCLFFKHRLLKENKYVFKSTEELAKNILFLKMINLGKKCELLGLELVDDKGHKTTTSTPIIFHRWCGGWDLNPRRPAPEDIFRLRL